MEAGVNQYYAGQPVVTLGLDIYNGTANMVELFRSITGVTFPLLMQGGSYSSQNSGDFRKVVIDPDGIVRYVSAPYVLNIATIRSHVDSWLPQEPTEFTFTMDAVSLEYSDGNSVISFTGDITVANDDARDLTVTVTPQSFPNPYRYTTITTLQGTSETHYGEHSVTEAMSGAAEVSFEIYNSVENPDNGQPEISPISGDHTLRVAVSDPLAPENLIEFILELIETSSGMTPRVTPIASSSALLTNYPNPFNPETTINFVVNNPGAVELNVYNMLGQNVANLVNTPFMSSGSYAMTWNATNTNGLPLPSGNYLVELTTPDSRAIHRIVLMR